MNLARYSLVLFLVCASVPTAQVESRRLSPPREQVPSDSLSAPTLSPDQKRLVYLVGSTSTVSLYSVPTDLSTGPALLAQLGVMNGPKVSPDSSRVLFLGNADHFDTRMHLFEVPIDGSGPAVDLTGTFGSVTSFEITPDSTTVVCRADFFTTDRFLLWSLPITGGAVLEESGPLGAGRDVEEFALTPDGARVLYRIDATIDDKYELHSAPLGPVPGSKRLDVPSASTEVGPRFVITSDGARVVYRRGTLLFSNPVDGSGHAVQLNGPATGPYAQDDFVLSGDGTRVVYRAGQNGLTQLLFSVPTDGSAAATPLTPALPLNANVSPGMAITPDDARVVYRADAVVDDQADLFSIPIDGSQAPIRLNSALPPGHDVLDGLAFTHDGTRVAFNAGVGRQFVGGLYQFLDFGQLFLVPVDGSAAPIVLDALAATRTELALAPGGLRFVYARQMGRIKRLVSARVDGSTPPLELSSGLSLGDFAPFLSEASFVYQSDDEVPGTLEVFARKTNGSTPRVRLSAALTREKIKGDVSAFRVAGKRAVYVEAGTSLAEDGSQRGAQLLSVPIEGGSPIRLDASIDVRSDIASPAIAGGRVLFLGNRTSNVELFSVPVKGSAPPIALSGALQVGGNVGRVDVHEEQVRLVVTTDGTRALYIADPDTEGIFDLYRVPTDGSTTAVKLSASQDTATSVFSAVATADGARALFLSSRPPANQTELYSADGLGPPVKLSGVMIPAGNVSKPALSGDGAWAFWIADAIVDEKFELFRAPTNGSASPVSLSGTLVPNADVFSYVVTPDAARVVFLAGSEVYTAPADGSAPPQRLTSGGDLQSRASSLLLAPDGTHVVYIYDRVGETDRLFSAPVDGSAPQTLLSPARHHSVWPAPLIQISADSTRVVYELGMPPDRGVWSSRLDGSGTPIRLEAPIPSSSQPTSFEISPDGQHVVYSVECFTGAKHATLFDVPIDRRRAPVVLTTTFPSVYYGATAFQFAPNSAALVYLLDADSFGVDDLFSVPLKLESPPRATQRH